MTSALDAGDDQGVDDGGADDYARMLASLDAAIDEALAKVESGRVYDPENERVRIKWIRALAYAVNVRRQVTNDRDLQDLAERVDQLESLQEDGGP